MPVLAQGNTANLTLGAHDSITLQNRAGQSASLTVAGTLVNGQHSGTRTYGPYANGGAVVLVATAGDVYYEVGDGAYAGVSNALVQVDTTGRPIRTVTADGQVVGGGVRLPSTLRVYGSSTFAGTGASSNARRLTSNVARIARLTETNSAIGGAILARQNGFGEPANDGGFATVLQGYAPSRAAGPWLSDLGVVIFGYNHNDAALYSQGAEIGRVLYRAALTAVIDRARSAAVFEESHSSVVLGGEGTWNNIASTVSNSGSAYRWNNTVGATVTITTPASFTGTDITIGGVAGVANITGHFPTLACTVNGQPAELYIPHLPQTPASASGWRVGYTMRLRGVPAGVNTIVITLQANPGGGSTAITFDYWQIEAEQPPIVVIPSAYRRRGAIHFEDNFLRMYADGRTVAEQYTDGSVVWVDLEPIIAQRAELFASDDLHINDRGMALASDSILGALYQVAPQVDVDWLV